MSEARGDLDLVGHKVIYLPDQNVGPLPPINNVIIRTKKPEFLWLEGASTAIGEWRAKLRSTYIRWALAINGLDVAANRYGSPDWPRSKEFFVTSLRATEEGERDNQGRTEVGVTKIAQWDGPTASEAHRRTMPMLAAFGIIDMYANLEEFVFALFRGYLNHHPDSIIEGPDFKELRRMRREAHESPEKQAAWDAAWAERLSAWQRKKLYQGLGKVFKSFCTQTGLKTPSFYKVSTVDTWAESIEIISLVRNALVHGAPVVTDELAAACAKPHAILFDFEKGQPMVIELYHLQGVDCFCDQLLTALNVSMVELMKGAPA